MNHTDYSADEREMRRLSVLQVCDSVFPVGAFALSNGMETFVQRDFLRTSGDFEQYLKNYLEVAAYREIGQMVIAGKIAMDGRVSDAGFDRKIADLDALCAALQSAREIRDGQTRMCKRMIKLADQMEERPLQPADARDARHVPPSKTGKTNKPKSMTLMRDTATSSTASPDTAPHCETASTSSAPGAMASGITARNQSRRMPHSANAVPRTIPHLDRYKRLIDNGTCLGLHSIAMGLFAVDRAPSLREAAVTYCYSLLSALTVCAVKAVPISQFAGQVALNRARSEIVAAVDLAFTLKPDDLGISGAYIDIAAMQHETLYSRLYMS